MKTHSTHLPLVLFTLGKEIFLKKISKCLFAQKTIEYLGPIIFCDGVAPDRNKIEAMLNWPIPTTIKQLRGF